MKKETNFFFFLLMGKMQNLIHIVYLIYNYLKLHNLLKKKKKIDSDGLINQNLLNHCIEFYCKIFKEYFKQIFNMALMGYSIKIY